MPVAFLLKIGINMSGKDLCDRVPPITHLGQSMKTSKKHTVQQKKKNTSIRWAQSAISHKHRLCSADGMGYVGWLVSLVWYALLASFVWAG